MRLSLQSFPPPRARLALSILLRFAPSSGHLTEPCAIEDSDEIEEHLLPHFTHDALIVGVGLDGLHRNGLRPGVAVHALLTEKAEALPDPMSGFQELGRTCQGRDLKPRLRKLLQRLDLLGRVLQVELQNRYEFPSSAFWSSTRKLSSLEAIWSSSSKRCGTLLSSWKAASAVNGMGLSSRPRMALPDQSVITP